jgi:membrane protease YdiL (CAAX protease family)
MVFAVGVRIVIGWLYYASGGSILIATLVHATFNATNNGDLLTRAAPDSQLLQDLPFYATAVLGLIVAVATRGGIGAPPKQTRPE